MLKEKITNYAKSLGFDLVGFSSAETDKKDFEFYKNWLKKKHHGEMKYLEKTLPRKNISKILTNAKTVISLGMNYYHEQKPLESGFGRVARYAYGRDYHKIIWKKLKDLEAFIKTLSPKANTKSFVDTGPILERSFAEKAGLGHVGKNCCLITKEFGSWVFLAEVITDLELSFPRRRYSTKSLPGQTFPLCGSCTRCIDACPTKAIIAPGVIDTRKCISYLTIENKKSIPKKFHTIIKKTKRFFGCDICQEICPHNCRAIIVPTPSVIPAQAGTSSCHSRPNLESTESLPGQTSKTLSGESFVSRKIAGDSLDLKKILSIKSDTEFLKTFAGSPLMRAKRKLLQRNAKCLL